MTYSQRAVQAPVERFWAAVDKSSPDGCWLWTAATSTSGYGVLQRGRRGGGLVRAHRFSFVLHHGPIPVGRIVCHHCDNKRCVNPAHLYAGTYSDNLRDALERGRNPMHENHRAQTHCLRGHAFDVPNTRVRNGQRNCRTCHREYARARRLARAHATVVGGRA